MITELLNIWKGMLYHTISEILPREITLPSYIIQTIQKIF